MPDEILACCTPGHPISPTIKPTTICTRIIHEAYMTKIYVTFMTVLPKFSVYSWFVVPGPGWFEGVHLAPGDLVILHV